MAYVKTQNGQVEQFPYTLGKLRQDNPNTSFPRRIPEAILASYGVYEVDVETAPTVDKKNYKAVRSDTPVEVSGRWVLQWSVVEKTAEEKKKYYDSAANDARYKRDKLLSETDWMALSDTPPMSEAWALYRQALRDITTHANWPDLQETDWPTKP